MDTHQNDLKKATTEKKEIERERGMRKGLD